jgi:putative oxidoreductase
MSNLDVEKLLFSSEPFIGNERAIAVVRIIVGLLMGYHGFEVFNLELLVTYSKWDQFNGLAYPLFFVYIGKGLELVTGFCLTLGFFTRVAAMLTVLNMLTITFLVGAGKFWYEDQHPFLFALLAVLFFFNGSGRWSLDNKLGN